MKLKSHECIKAFQQSTNLTKIFHSTSEHIGQKRFSARPLGLISVTYLTGNTAFYLPDLFTVQNTTKMFHFKRNVSKKVFEISSKCGYHC